MGTIIGKIISFLLVIAGAYIVFKRDEIANQIHEAKLNNKRAEPDKDGLRVDEVQYLIGGIFMIVVGLITIFL